MNQGQKAPVKLSSVVNASKYVPSTSSSSLIVAVRVRPLLKSEAAKGGRKDILRVIDDRVVVVLDPDESKDYLDQVQNRTKEKRYTFDVAFDQEASNEDVYNGTVRDLVSGVLYGINTTVFAYGATGSGKTYTMVGTPNDPGLMVLSLMRIFQDRDRFFSDEEFDVTCTYLEVYNETIYDLLVKSSGPLELREDPEQGVQVAGLRQISVHSAADILDLLEEGNKRRKTEATDANAVSSRSHAVLEICIKRSPKNHYRVQQLRAKLSLVDLAGSERAAETNNAGQKLRDGANINRSLLALANCINALGKVSGPGKAGAAYVPYRNSKLTRLLKDGLSGNSRTAMIATVASASDQYHHSINTLKYADRAKEIKTHVVQNVGTVESHIADYQRIIDNLQLEVQDLKVQLQERAAVAAAAAAAQVPSSNGVPSKSAEEDLMGVIDGLVQDMNENIEERINLQKAVFEIEDANLFNRYELKQLDEFLEAGQGGVKDIAEARDRRSDITAAIKDNERELTKFKTEISSNEDARKEIQARVDRVAGANAHSSGFLSLMSTFRLQALRVQELKFQMAVRDQVISEQREVITNLWRIIDKSGLGKQRVLDIARSEGIIMDGLLMPLQEPRPTTASDTDPVSSSSVAHAHGPYAAAAGGAAGGGIPESHVAVAGLLAAQDHHLATPNASLAGNRAKMRHRFWAQYKDAELQEAALGGYYSAGEESPSKMRGTRRRNALHAPGAAANPGAANDKGGGNAAKGAKSDLQVAAKRKGAGIRIDHLAHLHPPAASGRGRRQQQQAGGKAAQGEAGSGGSAAAGQAALASAVQGALAVRPVGGVANSNNMTVPTIRSGRRAGQPANGHTRSTSDENLGAMGEEGVASFAFALPPSGFAGGSGNSAPAATAVLAAGTPDDGGLQARRRAAQEQIAAAAAAAGGGGKDAGRPTWGVTGQAWGSEGHLANAGAGAGGGAALGRGSLPPVPPAQPPLGERLARLKHGRLPRKTEEGEGPPQEGGSAGSAAGQGGGGGGSASGPLPSVPKDPEGLAAAVQATLAVAGVGLLNKDQGYQGISSRPSSRTKSGPIAAGEGLGPPGAAGDALDLHLQQHSHRQSSAGSNAVGAL